MNDAEVNLIAAFVEAQSGIVLNLSKAYLVESRLTPIVEQFDFADVGALARGLARASLACQNAVVDALTTNETFFFRDKTPFALFENVILPQLVAACTASSRIRIWCAAASTGQEPYSLAMLLLKHKRMLGTKSVEIIATDISAASLRKAKDGLYTQFEVQRGLPVQMLMEHFTQEGAMWRISEQLKSMVKFSELNLVKPFSHLGPLDVVYCRNVLIYFESDTKRKVLDGVHNVLRPDGYLVMGAAETMMGHSEHFQRADGQRGLYQPAMDAKRLSA